MIKNMTIILLVLAIPIWTGVGWKLHDQLTNSSDTDESILPLKDIAVPRPLQRYSIESMSQDPIPFGKFTIVEQLSEEDEFISHKFEFEFSPSLKESETKTTTGLINIPDDEESAPIVLMIRGWAPEETYTHGVGTWRASEVFAQNGYITVAPDFLGYAGSDDTASDIFESRFQTYTTVLGLLESIDQIKEWDRQNLFIWAHSNGGQIALTTLAVIEDDPPATLWAPVSVFFPYSVLYYTNESSDRGKLIRKKLAEFEELYDVDKFSFDNYLEKIEGPLQIQLGTADDAIPVGWTNSLVDDLRKLETEVAYFTYPGGDHNLRPYWDDAVQRDLDFFNEHMTK